MAAKGFNFTVSYARKPTRGQLYGTLNPTPSTRNPKP